MEGANRELPPQRANEALDLDNMPLQDRLNRLRRFVRRVEVPTEDAEIVVDVLQRFGTNQICYMQFITSFYNN